MHSKFGTGLIAMLPQLIKRAHSSSISLPGDRERRLL
jgi:hypothetical protein